MGALLFAAGSVRAEDEVPRPRPWLSYGEPEEKHYLRAALEVSAVFALGEVQYQSETTNSTDWDLKYDWPDFRKKLTGEAIRFDTNRFDTNMITHPTAGLAYYVAARGNRLNVLESFLYAAAASTAWEYIGEPKEKASLNDLIVTPVSGAVFGEAFFELGVFLERSKKTPATTALAWLFAPTKEVHDWIDDAHPYRSSDRDGLGLTREIAHRFVLDAGAGITTQQGKLPAQGDARFGLHTTLLNVPQHDAAGRAAMFLPDATYSTIGLETTLGKEGLEDFQLDVLFAPVGIYVKRLERVSGELSGQRMFLGPTVGFDYGLHRYDRANPEEMDQISGVHVGGLALDHDWFAPPVRVHTTMQLRGELSAVRAIAVDAYFRTHPDPSSLPTVTREESYYFASEAVVAPGVEVSVGPVSIGASGRYESFWSIDSFDRYQEQIEQPQAVMHDRRTLTRAWLGVAPTSWLGARLGVDHRTRDGEVANVSARREETSLWTTVGAVF
jgi:hypothetical protein